MEIIFNGVQTPKPTQRFHALIKDRVFIALVLAFSVLTVLDQTLAYAAIPLISGLMEMGMTSGAAMAFITSGAVSSIPAALAVYALVRKPIFAMYLVLGLTGSMLAGYIFQIIVGA